jgi:hypothetical protein
MKTNKIKAVDMVREIRDRQYAETRNMDPSEERAYYQQRAEALLARLETAVAERQDKLTTA